MSRVCNNCKNIIPSGANHIEVRFVGMENVKKFFKDTLLDFCSLKCLVIYWSDKRWENGEIKYK